MKLKSGDKTYKINKTDREGNTIFGYNKLSSMDNSDYNKLSNSKTADIYLPLNLPVDSEIPLFKIYFDTVKSLYYFKSIDSHPSVLIQVKLNPIGKWEIKKNDRFLLGDMVFKIDPSNEELTVTRLVTKRYNEKITKTFYLENDGDNISIGRGKNCSMSLNSGLLSRVHASVIYCENDEKWELRDGEINKPSSNGCYIFTSNQVAVYDGLEIKINEYTVLFYLS